MSALSDQITSALERYESDDNLGALFDTLRAVARNSDVDTLIRGAEPFRERPECDASLRHFFSQRRRCACAVICQRYWLRVEGEVVGG